MMKVRDIQMKLPTFMTKQTNKKLCNDFLIYATIYVINNNKMGGIRNKLDS